MTILLFDVGDVIVEADHEITHRRLQDYGTPIEKALLFFKNGEIVDKQIGAVPKSVLADKLSKQL